MFNRLLEKFGIKIVEDEWWNNEKTGVVNIPPTLIGELEEIANRHKITITDVLRKFLKLGFLAEMMDQKGKKLFILNDDGTYSPLDLFSRNDDNS